MCCTRRRRRGVCSAGNSEGSDELAGDEDAVLHAVDDFFVSGDDGGEDAAEGDWAVRRCEVVGAETDAAAHGADVAGAWFEERVFDDGGGGEFLDDPWVVRELGGGGGEGLGPFVLTDVVADDDGAAAPCEFGEAAEFEDETPLFLGEGGDVEP